MDSNKIYQLLAGFYLIHWKIPQNMISVIPRKTLIVGFHFSKLGCCKPAIFQKNPPRLFLFLFFRVWRIFSEDRKNNSRWIAQKMLRKRVTQVLQRKGERTGVAIFTIFWVTFVLMVFQWTGVSSRFGKVVGYKVEIPIPDLWILKEGEVLANEVCRGS